MVAYMISDVEITDARTYDAYRTTAAPILARYGGEVIAAGKYDRLEGDWAPANLFIVRFPSLAVAREFYHSREYREVLALRQRSARCDLVLIEGT